ncbi:pyridoxamine 5'-phosphate oxidase family protein [Microbacterium sp.]|uniref:pyridoxamine 5'-phosphate oxidase family protein n=1 Tax=Microbacterium sp. TaxID=51671 RepID=UPI002810AA43|nr:pyridoxamine 5'-phosphate oxidase family protein [Microbacterium sp.]
MASFASSPRCSPRIAGSADEPRRALKPLRARASWGLVESREKIDELWNPVVEAWFTGGKDDPDVGGAEVHRRLGGVLGHPVGKIAAVFSFVKVKVAGDRPDGGDSGKVDH